MLTTVMEVKYKTEVPVSKWLLYGGQVWTIRSLLWSSSIDDHEKSGWKYEQELFSGLQKPWIFMWKYIYQVTMWFQHFRHGHQETPTRWEYAENIDVIITIIIFHIIHVSVCVCVVPNDHQRRHFQPRGISTQRRFNWMLETNIRILFIGCWRPMLGSCWS